MTWRAAIASLTALAAAFVVAASGRDGGSAMVLTHGDRRDDGTIRYELIAQPVNRLYPGAVRPLKVTVVNEFRFPLVIRSLSGRLVGTSKRGCPATAASLQVRGYSSFLPITIKPGSRRLLPGSIPVAMPRTATAGCSGSRFWISISSTGWRGR